MTPVLEPALHELGFRRAAWEFPLMVGRFDDSLTDADVAPSRWYLSSND